MKKGQNLESKLTKLLNEFFTATQQHGMAPISPQPGDSQEQIIHKFREVKKYANNTANAMEKISKPGVQEQKIGEVVTPRQGRVYAQPGTNPLEPPPAAQPDQQPSAPGEMPANIFKLGLGTFPIDDKDIAAPPPQSRRADLPGSPSFVPFR